MPLPTIFDTCTLRSDVKAGRTKDEEFAADLSKVVNRKAVADFQDPAVFFKNTHPTRGLQKLLQSVCRRLSGAGGELNSVIRLDTQYGGGKTHSLIALYHAVEGMKGVANPEEFIDPKLLPKGNVRVAALDGENADPANGLELERGLRAYSIWGEMAYRLAGVKGYESVRKSDETRTAPGAETIAALFGNEPSLILIDEVSVYLRKTANLRANASGQFSAFLQALIKAVTTTPKAALVCTLAVRNQDQEAADAYKAEHQEAMKAFEEAQSIVSRTLLQIDPTAEDETVEVLRRRLFETVDEAKAKKTLEAYFSLWDRNKESLSPEAVSTEIREQFRRGYPFHPELLNVLTEKVSSLSTFQRTRGMLRLLTRTAHYLWKNEPADTYAIHPHHIDPTYESIRDELTTRLERNAYSPVLAADVAAASGREPSIAQQIDRDKFPGQPPATSFAARTIFLNTMAYTDNAQGVKPERLRWSVCSPALEPSFVEAARKNFVAESLYLDDRPGAPMRFRTEPNLNQIVSRAMRDNVPPEELRDELNAQIKQLYQGKDFELISFPAGAYQVPDEIGDGKPFLVVLHYDAFAVSSALSELPHELSRMATRKGVNEELRSLQNNLVFLVADERQRADMKNEVRRRLALSVIQEATIMQNLADYQQRKVREEHSKSATSVAQAIAQCYRHMFFPSHTPVGSGDAKLGHTALELDKVSYSPGQGQSIIRRALRDQKKLLCSGDNPDAPTFVRDQTPLKIKGKLATLELRNEFRRAPKLSMLLGDDPMIACIRLGIQDGHFIYQKGDQVWGQGDPEPSIEISENAFVYTLPKAKELNLWPRHTPEPKTEPGGAAPGPGHGGGDGTAGGATPGTGATTPPPAVTDLFAEGPLRQALVELFDKCRKAKVQRLASITIRLFEWKGAFAVYQAAATHQNAETTCAFQSSIEGEGLVEFSVGFKGTVNKASQIKSFLEPQLRTATNSSFQGEFELKFKAPLLTQEDKATDFINAMVKHGGGEAYVEAQAAEAGMEAA